MVDAFGRRIIFCSMAALYGLVGGAEAFVSHYPTLLAMRAVQGIGFAAVMPLTITLVGDAFKGLDQVRAQGRRQVVMMIAELALPIIGAALVAVSWRAPLLAQSLLLPIAIAGWFVLDDSREPVDARAYAGQLGSAVRQPGMPSVLLAGFFRFFFKFAILAYLPVMLVNSRGASVTEAAIVVSISSAAAALAGTQVVRLLRWGSPSRLVFVSVLIVGASLLGFAVSSSWLVALMVALVFGLGDGVVGVLQNGYATQSVSEEVRGGIVSINGMGRNLGKFLAPVAMGGLAAVASLPFSFGVMAAVACALAPGMLPLRHMDGAFKVRGGAQGRDPALDDI
jgi:MFS transporter, ACDE family, multidrug resistance protein